MTGALYYLLSFVVALGVLVTVHEFGHFWVARRLGVKVLRFSVGFGAPLWVRRFGQDRTELVVAALPLGGYVKMLDEREGEVAEVELPRAFNRQPVLSRIAIVAAGPVFNFLFAIATYWLVFMLGIPGLKPVVGAVAPDSVAAAAGVPVGGEIVAVNGRATPTWRAVDLAALSGVLARGPLTLRVRTATGGEGSHALELGQADLNPRRVIGGLGITPDVPELPAVVDQVVPRGPGDRGGMRPGDRVTAMDGRPISQWKDLVDYVRDHGDQDILVRVERDGVALGLTVRAELRRSHGAEHGYIGVAVRDPMRVEWRYGPLGALQAGMGMTWDMSVLTLRFLGGMLVGRASLDNLSGPISIAQYAGESASLGLVPSLYFLAIVSLSLGVLNLLPIPVLDGGHLMYYLIELVKGSPLSERVQAAGQWLGIVLLAGLMVLALYNDLLRVTG